MKSWIERLQRWMEQRPGRATTLIAWFTQAISIGSNLVILPLVLVRVGADSKIWFFLLTWIGLFSLLDFGFSQCISRQITFSVGQKGFMAGRAKGRFIRVAGPRAVGNILSASRFLFRSVSLLILICGVVFERTFLFEGNMAAGWSARICWYEIIAYTILVNEIRVYLCALTGMLFIPQLRLIGLTQTVIQNALTITMLLVCPRLELLGLVNVIASVYACVRSMQLWCTQKSHPVVTMRPKRLVILQLWYASWEQGVASAANYFTGAVNPIVIGYMIADPNAVSGYFLPLRICSLMFSAITDIMNPQLNYLISLYRDHNIHGLLVKFFKIMIFVSALGLLAYGSFAILGHWIILAWSLGRIHPSPWLFVVMSLYWFLALLQTMLAIFITAHGVQPFAKPAVSGAILNLILVRLLPAYFGLVGAALATFIAQLLTSNWYMPWYSTRLFREHFKQVPFRVALRDSLLSLQADFQSVLKFLRLRRS